MEHDQEMTEVFEEEPQAMDTSDGTPMEQRQEIIINTLKKQFQKPVLATLSDEITKNIFFSAINANLTERFGSATRPKQPEVMGHLIGMMGQKMMERVISSLQWQCNMQRQVMEEVIPAMLEEIRGILVQQMMQLVKPTVDQIMNDIFPATEL